MSEVESDIQIDSPLVGNAVHLEEFVPGRPGDGDRSSALSDLQRFQTPQCYGVKRGHVPDRAGGYSTRSQDRVKTSSGLIFLTKSPNSGRGDPEQARRPDNDYLHLYTFF